MSSEIPPWMTEENLEPEEEQAPDEEEEEDDKSDNNNAIICLFCFCTLTMLAAAVLLILTFVVGIFDDDKKEQPPTSTFPDNCSAWKELPDYSMRAILEEPESAQTQALQWLCDDPNLEEYPTQKRLQRFALAVLYLGLEGENWQWRDEKETTTWLTYTNDECDWNIRDDPTNQVLQGVVCDESATTPTTVAKSSQPNTPNIFEHKQDDEEDSSFRKRRLQQSSSSGSITALLLDRTNLVGTLPPEIQLFQQLQVLDLGYNQLSGTVPEYHFVQGLPQLVRANLTNNAFRGTLQPSKQTWLNLFKHDALEVLDLSSNRLAGLLSSTSDSGTTSILATSPIRVLSLGNNSFTGPLSPQWGNTNLLANLEVLELNDNQWTGTLPSRLGLLSNLKSVLLHDNEGLNGTIPVEWKNLATANLQHANIQNTSLTGVIPKELCSIEKELLYDCGPLCGCHNCTCGGGGDDETDGTATTEAPSTIPDDDNNNEEEDTDLVDSDGNDTNTTAAGDTYVTDDPTTTTVLDVGDESDNNSTATTSPDDAAEEEVTIELVDEVDDATATNATTTTNSTVAEGNAAQPDETAAEEDNVELVDEENTAVDDATPTNATTANATDPEQPQELTEPLDFGLVERYSMRYVNNSWNNNRFLIHYRATDYILDDSISYVLYDDPGCRNGGTEVEDPNRYLLVDIQAPSEPPVDLTNEGKGSRSPYRVEVRLNRTTIGEAPFFVPTGDNTADLLFCFGLRINYNKVDGWNQDLEVTAAEHSMEMTTDLSDNKRIQRFKIVRSTYFP